jgi:electron transport complex protein RnfC
MVKFSLKIQLFFVQVYSKIKDEFMEVFYMKKMNSIFISPQKQGGHNITEVMKVPKELVIPVQQHIGAPPEILVKIGETIKKGDVLASGDAPMCVPIHAPLSGCVREIYDFVLPSGVRTRAIKLSETFDEEIEFTPPEIQSKEEFLTFVKDRGTVGLGGASFPTHIKLNPQKKVDTLIVNAAECEPRLTADQREIVENPESIIRGINLIKKYTGVEKAYIAIENRGKAEIELLKELTKNEDSIDVAVLKPTYPQGAEKVLIYNVLGRVVPEGGLPMDAGVIVMNVSTVGFIGASSVSGAPLIRKRITVGGDCLKESKNIFVPVGTKVKDIAEYLGGYVKEPVEILLGGPMMGQAVYSDEYPIMKNTNAVLFLSEKAIGKRKETSCIRCGRCIKGCPFDLNPVKLADAYETRDAETLKKEHIMLCMECGSCSYVCPAGRHLTQSHRLAKAFYKERSASKNGR